MPQPATQCHLEPTVVRRLAIVAFPKNTALPPATQRHLEPTVKRRLAICMAFPNNTALPPATQQHLALALRADHRRPYRHSRRLTPPIFAPTQSRFYCKTPHFARHLTFGRIVSVVKHSTSGASTLHLLHFPSSRHVFYVISFLTNISSKWHLI